MFDGFVKSSTGKARKPPPRGLRHTSKYAAVTKDEAQLEHPDFLQSRQDLMGIFT
jgi:hypothetical protein